MREFRFVNLLGAVGKIRRETWEGREHLVVPVVALVEGAVRAMNAKGFEMVRAEKFGVAPFAWDGRPLMAGHPVAGKTPISANDPRILARSFGRVHNTRIDNKRLCMEAWIDVEKARSMPESARVLERCEAHERGEANAKPIEVSVGAGVTIKDESGTWGDRAYRGAWDVIMPDHLALLAEDQVGACSVAMGCGALRAAMLTEDGIRHLEGEEIAAALRGAEWDESKHPRGEDGRWVDEDGNALSMEAHADDPNNRVRIIGKKMEHTGKIGKLRGVAPSGHFAGVVDEAGNSLGSYHQSDLEPVFREMRSASKEKPGGLMTRLKQKAFEFLRLAQSPEEMSDQDLRAKLGKALAEMVPGFVSVEAIWPVINPTRVVYSCRDAEMPPAGMNPADPYPMYTYCREERTFTLSDAGVVTIGDTAIEVQPAMYWEPCDPEEEDMRGLAARIHACAGRRHSAADEEMVQSVHDHSVRLGATCAEPRAAAAHECPCKKKNNPIQEEDMDRKQKIAALAANPHSAIKDVKVLETLDDATLMALQSSADAQGKAETDLRAAQEALTQPVGEDRLPAEYRTMMADHRARETAEHAGLVAQLRAAQTSYSEDELKAMPLDGLRKLAGAVRIPAAPSFAGRAVPRVASEGRSFAAPDPYAPKLKALAAGA